MSNGMLFVLLAAPILLLWAFISWKFIIKKKTPAEKELEAFRKMLPKSKKRIKYDIQWEKLYPKLEMIPVVREILSRVTFRLKSIYVGRMKEVRPLAARYVVISIGTFIVLMLGSLLFFDELYTQLSVIMAGLYIINVINNIFITRTQRKLLDDVVSMLQTVRYEYQQSRMIIKSLLKVSETTKGLASIHATKIAEILSDLDPEQALDMYYKVAPNRYLKMFAGVALNTYKNGDIEKSSTFLNSIKNIVEEARLEILTRDKLAQKMTMVSFIAVFPAFVLESLRTWAENNFDVMAPFYTSMLGNYCLFIIVFSLPLSFYVLENFKYLSEDNIATQNEGRIARKFLKYPWFSKYIGRVAPAHRNSKRSILIDSQASRLLRNASSTLTVKEFYAQKVLCVIFSFWVVLATQIIVIVDTKSSVFSITNQQKIAGMDEEVRVAKNDFELRMRDEVIDQELDYDSSKAWIDSALGDLALTYSPDMPRETYVDTVIKKIEKYRNLYFKWYNVLFAGLLGIIAFWGPNMAMLLRASLRKSEMQFEVDGFYGIIGMLKSFPRIMVYELLEEMFRYSKIFRNQISESMLSYESGPHNSLEKLKIQCGYEPLSKIAERLQVAADLIPVNEAFDDLDADREYSIKRREMEYERIINFRGSVASQVCMIPTYAAIVLYLAFPFMYVSVQEFEKMNSFVVQ